MEPNGLVEESSCCFRKVERQQLANQKEEEGPSPRAEHRFGGLGLDNDHQNLLRMAGTVIRCKSDLRT